MNDTNTLRRAIEAAYEKRADLTPSNIDAGLRQAIEDCIGLLDSGQARVAEKTGGDWVVNGTKQFISGAGVNDLYLTMVRTGEPGPKGVSCLAIEKGMPGVSFGARQA